MRSIPFVLTLTFAVAVPAFGQVSGRSSAPSKAISVEEQVLLRENEWTNARRSNDVARLAKYESDELEFTNEQGRAERKGQLDKEIAEGVYKPEFAENSLMGVRIYNGDVAVVTGVFTFKGTRAGTPVSGRQRFTDMWIYDGDGWKVVSSHVTPIIGPDRPPPVVTGAAQPPPPFTKSQSKPERATVEKEILKLEEDYARSDPEDIASKKKDDAPDLILIDENGQYKNKDVLLEEKAQGAWKIASHGKRDLKVRGYGNAAITTGIYTVKGTHNGKDVSGSYRYTNLWVKKPTAWKIVSCQMTLIQGKE